MTTDKKPTDPPAPTTHPNQPSKPIPDSHPSAPDVGHGPKDDKIGGLGHDRV